MESKPLELGLLRSFSPLDGLKSENLHALARKTVLRELSIGRMLFKEGDTDKRTVLGLHRDLAPIKVAVLPLTRNEKLVPEARRVFDLVKPEWMSQYDDAGAIGRRYRRQDEVGTPFCVTVDFDSLDDRQVTVRERDTMHQDRIPIVNLLDYLQERL